MASISTKNVAIYAKEKLLPAHQKGLDSLTEARDILIEERKGMIREAKNLDDDPPVDAAFHQKIMEYRNELVKCIYGTPPDNTELRKHDWYKLFDHSAIDIIEKNKDIEFRREKAQHEKEVGRYSILDMAAVQRAFQRLAIVGNDMNSFTHCAINVLIQTSKRQADIWPCPCLAHQVVVDGDNWTLSIKEDEEEGFKEWISIKGWNIKFHQRSKKDVSKEPWNSIILFDPETLKHSLATIWENSGKESAKQLRAKLNTEFGENMKPILKHLEMHELTNAKDKKSYIYKFTPHDLRGLSLKMLQYCHMFFNCRGAPIEDLALVSEANVEHKDAETTNLYLAVHTSKCRNYIPRIMIVKLENKKLLANKPYATSSLKRKLEEDSAGSR